MLPICLFLFFFLCGYLGPPSGENAVFVFFLGGHFAPRIVNIFSEAAARSLKNIEMFLEAATHKKISAAHFLSEAAVH